MIFRIIGFLAVVYPAFIQTAFADPALEEQVNCSTELNDISNAIWNCSMADKELFARAQKDGTVSPSADEGYKIGDKAFAIPHGSGFWVLSDSQEGVADFHPNLQVPKAAVNAQGASFPFDPTEDNILVKASVPGKGEYTLVLQKESNPVNRDIGMIRNIKDMPANAFSDKSPQSVIESPEMKDPLKKYFPKKIQALAGMDGLDPITTARINNAIALQGDRINRFLVKIGVSDSKTRACLMTQIPKQTDLGKKSCAGIHDFKSPQHDAFVSIKAQIDHLKVQVGGDGTAGSHTGSSRSHNSND